MAQSPAHYLANAVEETNCMEQGSAVDALVFGTLPVVAYPGPVRRGEEWEAWKADHPDDQFMVTTQHGLEEATSIADSIRANSLAMKCLEGDQQMRIEWNFCGRACASTPDVLGYDFVTELKVSQTSNPARFRWHALKMHYHCQLAFYAEAREAISVIASRRHYIVCAESKAPYVVTVFELSERAIEQGRRTNRLWMERLLQCEAANEWPGYSQSLVDLDVSDDFIVDGIE